MTKFQEQVYKKLGKRPKPAARVAEQLGYSTHHGVARALGALWVIGAATEVYKDGQIVGWAKVA